MLIFFRFIDDLTALNDHENSKRSFHESYPLELELQKENCGYLEGSKMFDKRESLSFSIVRMPYLDSINPCETFNSVFGVEILRSARKSNDATIFQRNFKNLINRVMKRGVKMNRLSTTLSKLSGRHFDVFLKYNNTPEFVE